MSKEFILKAYLRLLKKTGRLPSRDSLKQAGITRDALRHHFVNLTNLKLEAHKESPDSFLGILDEDLLSDHDLDETKATVSKYKKFVITTAVVGQPVEKRFYKSIKTYCKKNKALLVVIPVEASGAIKAGQRMPLELHKEVWAVGDVSLNNNVQICGILTNAKQVNPLTGLKKLAKQKTIIMGSPKQARETVANSKTKIPHVMVSTGAITKAVYQGKAYMSNRSDYLARMEHRLGAVLVNVENAESYHFSEIRCDASGSFAHMGTLYKPNGSTSTAKVSAFVMGDLHVTQQDEAALDAWVSIAKKVKPKAMVYHDFTDGISISHWKADDIISKTRDYEKGLTSIENELTACAEMLTRLKSCAKTHYVVDSNHNDFFSRYIRSKRFQSDHENFRISVKMAAMMLDGKNAVEEVILSKMSPKDRKNVIFTKEDKDLQISGFEVAVHGHRGANGSKGSLKGLANCFDKIVIGHSHTPGLTGDAYQVGTTTGPQGYEKGPSSHMHTSCLIYENGTAQLVNSIFGKVME